MGFGEHVLDLPTGLDVPFRDYCFPSWLGCSHCALLPEVLEPHAFPHALHNGKGHLRLETRVHEVNHDDTRLTVDRSAMPAVKS